MWRCARRARRPTGMVYDSRRRREVSGLRPPPLEGTRQEMRGQVHERHAASGCVGPHRPGGGLGRLGAGLSDPDRPRHRALRAGRSVRRVLAHRGAEAVRRPQAGLRGREPAGRQHHDRHRRGGEGARRTATRCSIISQTHATNESLVANKPFQLMRDFAPVSPIYTGDLVMVVHKSVPVKTLQGVHRARQVEARQP